MLFPYSGHSCCQCLIDGVNRQGHWEVSNPLKPVVSCTITFNIQKFYVVPTEGIYVVYLTSEETSITSLYGVNI
jgi:hypothetical protein